MLVIFRGFLRLFENSSIQISFEFKHDAHMEASIGQARTRDVTLQFVSKMTKQFAACNWVPSRIIETHINGYVVTGALASKNVLHWRVPGPECPPEPQDGEVIVFMQHLDRGFSPPGSKKFRDVLASFQLHPQDIGPNCISNIGNTMMECNN